MARYSIEITATAEKQLRKIPRNDQVRVVRAMMGLADDPHPHGCRKFTGYEDVYRIRAGTYRIIYCIERHKVIIVILKIGHRKDVYR